MKLEVSPHFPAQNIFLIGHENGGQISDYALFILPYKT
jgi:hypothetical protein